MQAVPQIVRERLKASTTANNHPEAGVLTAFVERSLPAPERVLIMEHLSRCADCRDIVALALPEMEAVTHVAVPASRPWLTWPALRWGFGVAGILAIATFGVLKYRQGRPPETIVAQQIPSAVSSPEAVTTAPASVPPPNAAAGAEKLQARTLSNGNAESKLDTRQETAPPALGSLPVPRSSGAEVQARVANHFGKPVPRPPQPDPYPSPAFVAVPKQPSSNVATADAGSASSAAAAQVDMFEQNQSAQVQASEPPSAASESLRIGKAKPAEAPTWTISDTGVLERSFDQGSTWQDVDVTAADTQVSAGVANLEASSGTAPKKFNHRIAVKRPEPAPVFRAVTANGVDVWAGGAAGVLYHSVDAGNRWTRVVPGAGSVTLTGDIVSVDFSDTLHGRIATSTAQTWTTSNDGQTWQQQ